MCSADMRPLLLLATSFVLGCCGNDVNTAQEFSSPSSMANENASTSSRSTTYNSSLATSTVTGISFSRAVGSSLKPGRYHEFFNESFLMDAFSKPASLIVYLPQLELIPKTKCQSDFLQAVRAAVSAEEWALKMLDSWAKPRSFLGITALRIAGDYYQCRNTTAPSKEATGSIRYRGNYCVVNAVPASLVKMLKRNFIAGVELGLCMPDTCSEEEVTSLINTGLRMFNISDVCEVLETDCRNEYRESTAATVIAVVLLCIIGFLMLTGTVLDIAFVHRPEWFNQTPMLSKNQDMNPYYHRSETGEKDLNNKQKNQWKTSGLSVNGHVLKYPEGEKDSLTGKKSSENCAQGNVGKILLSFSIYSNGKNLINTNQSPETLTAINGIRVITMWWIVFSHVLFFGLTSYNFELRYYGRILRRRSYDVFLNSTVSVDTFFSISGILTSYLLSKKMEKTGWKIKWHQVFFHRYWRLTPPYLLVLVTVVGLGKFMGSGPMWASSQSEYIRHCDKYWWTNLLYINNLVHPVKQCGKQYWFLAVEMQFFLLSPLMLIPFCINLYAGFGSCLIFLLVDWITAGVLSAEKNWTANMLRPPEEPFANPSIETYHRVRDLEFYTRYYYMFPFTRIGPYVVGVLAGKFLAVTNRQFKIQWYVVILCWIIALTTGLAVVYGTHGNSEGRSMAALYNAVSRTAWGVSVCWVVVACALGYGGPINALLSWSPFVVLGRLTYMVYLVHVTVIDISLRNMDGESTLTNTTVAVLYMGINMAAGLVAFVLALCFESPLAKLEKIFLSKQVS